MCADDNYDRRKFLSTALGSVVAARLGAVGIAGAGSRETDSGHAVLNRSSNGSFGALNQIDAGVLNVGYADEGPPSGTPVILLHGWPYDIHAYADVTPLLTSKGYRVIVPYLRGYGTTRFLSSETPRNG